MEGDNELTGLRELHVVLQHSAEVLAALIGTIRGQESVAPDLLEAADAAMHELSRWSARLREVMVHSPEAADVRDLHH